MLPKKHYNLRNTS